MCVYDTDVGLYFKGKCRGGLRFSHPTVACMYMPNMCGYLHDRFIIALNSAYYGIVQFNIHE